MGPKGEFDPAKQYSPGEEVDVTLLTINQGTRRITGSIQHVADVAPEEVDYVAEELGGGFGTLGAELAAQNV